MAPTSPDTLPLDPRVDITVTCSDPSAADWTRGIARRLGMQFSADNTRASGYLLELGASGWALHTPTGHGLGTLRLDFGQGRTAWRLRQAGRRQPLGRALGLKPGQTLDVVDATAGLGRDGLVLASLGCRVILVERNPVMALLLTDALQRTAPPELRERVQVVEADARDYLANLEHPPTVVYLDPMYPERSKSALVRKEMRILRALVGPDPDASLLLAAALNSTIGRVVIKRPRGAPTVEDTPPTHQVKGPNTRYDVYLRQTAAWSADE